MMANTHWLAKGEIFPHRVTVQA